MVNHEETYVAFQGHVWECPCGITVYPAGMFVGERTKAEDVAVLGGDVVFYEIGILRAGGAAVGLV